MGLKNFWDDLRGKGGSPQFNPNAPLYPTSVPGQAGPGLGGGFRPGIAPPPVMFPQQQQGFSVGDVGGWMKDKAKDVGGWLGEGDNLLTAGSLGLGAYGAYQQGKAADQELKRADEMRSEEQRRYDDERRRKSEAAKALLPFLMQNMQGR